jgi:hypothetical protein
MYFFCVCVILCVGIDMATADPPSKESYRFLLDQEAKAAKV